MLKPIGSGSPTTQVTQTDVTDSQKASSETTTNQEAAETLQQASKNYAASRLSEQGLFTQVLSQQLQSQPAVSTPQPPIATGASSADLSRGSEGAQVQQLQKELNEWRVSNGMTPIAEDGVFGGNTETAVREFQKATGLKEDGIAGANSRIRMQMENSVEFKSLDPSSQNTLRQCSIDWQNDPAKRSQLNMFVQDSGIATLSMPHQEKAIQSFVQNPDSWMKLTGVYANDSFRKLDEASKSRLMEMGTKNIKDDQYMKDLSDFMASPDIYGASPGQARKLLDDFEIGHSPMVKQEEWKNLDPGTQKRLGDLYLSWKEDPEKAQQLWMFVADGALSELSEANRNQVVDAFEKNPGGWFDRVGIYANDNFRKMDDSLKSRTLDMTTAHATDPAYIKDLNDLFMSADFYNMSNAEKAQALTDFDANHMPIT